MYVVGGLFWVSEVAKAWQEVLEKDYNMPTYGVFIILAVATIIVGLSLGGVSAFVCVLCVCVVRPECVCVCIVQGECVCVCM